MLHLLDLRGLAWGDFYLYVSLVQSSKLSYIGGIFYSPNNSASTLKMKTVHSVETPI